MTMGITLVVVAMVGIRKTTMKTTAAAATIGATGAMTTMMMTISSGWCG
jgi:hypothetical protein